MESVLADAVTSILKIVAGRATTELTLALGFKDDLNKLVEKLQMIQSTLLYSGVENWSSHKPISSPVQLWLKKVQRIAYDAEDIFDLLAYEKVRRGLGSKIPLKRRVCFFFSSSNPIIFRQSMAHRINRVIKAIDEVERDAHTVVNITAAVAGAGTSYSGAQGFRLGSGSAEGLLQQTREHVDLHNVVGRDRDEALLVDKLCGSSNPDNDHISVIAVVGVGGLGKTVLARKVSKNRQVTGHFAQRIWVAVSQDFNISKILSNMLEVVDGSNSRNASSERAIRKLSENLNGKRYLLVLDDVWNTHQGLWNAMKSTLESIGGSKDSMILVTTRDKVVAKTMQATSIHELPELLQDDSWFLFKQVAFASKSVESISMLETTGEKIVRKCKGNPLAIKTIGGILQSKQHSYEWENIERSELWDLPQDDNTGILPSLMLSYNHLPSPFLKKCFSFVAILPKGCKLGKKWLTFNWVALGLIQQFDNRELMEDIVEGYINVLLNISFLQEANRDNELGDINLYVMHDLVHDLARSVSRKELLSLEEGKQVTTISDVRHLAINGHVEVTSDSWDKLVVENLRSLDIGESSPRDLLEYVKYLRVLYLQKVGLEDAPKSVTRLKCLKYLNLTRNPLKVLPEFITELYNLQILSLNNCELLTELPRGLANLVNLRHLYINRLIKVPAGMIEQLRCLQTLPPLCVRDGGFQIAELEYLPNVSGDLEIHGLEVIKSKQDAESAHISEKSRVKKLKLFWNSDDDWLKHEEVLEGLTPNRNMRLLKIQGYGGEKFPSWILGMDAVYNLVKIIELVGCTRCQKLPTLGNLQALERLEIRNMDSLEHIGAELYCNPEILTEDASSSSNSGVLYFPSLKKLQLCGLQNFTEWGEPCSGSRSSIIFPSLEVLVMEDCPELKTTPNNFPSLTKLVVINNTSGLPMLNILDNESNLTYLKNLHIEKVVELTSLSQKMTENCTSLQTLQIDNCQNLICLPENLSKLVSLEFLRIRNCSKLESLPNLSGLASLHRLQIFLNDNLKYPPEGLQCCTSLERLLISNCPQVETLPNLTALTHLTVLDIRGMPKMLCQLPDWIYNLPRLQTLHIGRYYQLDQFPDISSLLRITSLKTLLLYGWINQHADIGLPEQLQYFKTLGQLQIIEFENLESLPDWIGNLSSLQLLLLSRCNKLKKLAAEDAMKRLTKLRYLKIEECPLLEEAVKINGTEHHKISRIKVETE